MGRELEAMDSVPAGNVLGNISTTIIYPTYHLRQEYLMCIWYCIIADSTFDIISGLGGLEEHILKTATIADTLACPAFTDMHMEAAPIVRVAVEPTQAGITI